MTANPPPRTGTLRQVLRVLLSPGPLRALRVSLHRRDAARRIRRDLQAHPPRLAEAIGLVERRWEGAVGGNRDEKPIFILGAGWRCGSTWLQRLVMSSGRALVWGEPFDRSGIVQGLSAQLLPLGPDWPPQEWLHGNRHAAALADEWIANLYPSVPDLLEAHRSLFRTLFASSARARGAERWGLKEVRLTTAHAAYLRLLFPGAKFVFLVRHPADAYQSYRSAGNPWFERWPDRLTVSAAQFGEVWARLAGDFLENHAAVGGLLLRYEEVTADARAVHRISEYLELPLTPEAAARPIRGTPHAKETLPTASRRLLMRQVKGVGRRLGYA